MPAKWGFSVINTDYIMPYGTSTADTSLYTPKMSVGVLQYSLYGFSVSVIEVQTSTTKLLPDKPIFGCFLTNPEFRVGGNITPWLDASLCLNYSYTYTWNEQKSGAVSSKANFSEYRYGGAISFCPWVDRMFVLTLKGGYRNGTLHYKIWDGYEFGSSVSNSEKGMFIQVGLNIFATSNDGKILRLWRRSLTDIGRY